MIGHGIAYRVWPLESAEVAEFREHSRQFNYAIDSLPKEDDETHRSVDETRRWLDRYRANHREQDVFRQYLRDLGLPPDPPADWTPANETARN